MKIKNIKIQNFRSIKNEVLEFPENVLISIIGANNAGKSNFLRAIDLVLGESWNNGDKLEEYDYYCGNRENKILIEINFTDGKKVIFDSNEKWPTYYNSSGGTIYSSQGNVKDDFPCTYLSAERSISKDTAFTKWSLMGKISKSFNKSISDEQKEKLKTHFDGVKEIFNGVEKFSNFENDFKKYFQEMQSDSPYKLDIDFKAFTPNNYFKSINILATDPNVENNIDIEELGDGAKNLTIISLLRSYAKNFRDANGILAIEEPEIYLHPQARKHLFEVLKELATTGIQVIYTTHDPNFLEIGEFESIRRISKVDDEENPGRKYSKINSLSYQQLLDFSNKTGGPQGNTVEKVKNFYKSISNYRLTEGFFSNYIILGEGPTEELVIPKYFEKNNFKYNSKGISILGAIGKSQITKYWRLFNQFGIPVICLFDNDNSDGNGKNEKEKVKNNQLLCNCFSKNISDLTNGLNANFYKEIKIDNGKLVILEKDIENVIIKDFIENGNTEDDYNDLIQDLETRPKQIFCSNIVQEIINNYGYIPKFIKSLQNIDLEIIQDKEISIEDISF